VDIYVGASARAGHPTRVQAVRRRLSGSMQAAARPYIRWWMSGERETRVQGVRLRVPVGVFPPRLFHSTKLVCRTVDRLELVGASFLEVGCGSGAISVAAARRRARVTAIDISDVACVATRANAALNGVHVEVIESDLFAHVHDRFDVVVITPPFFRHDPSTQLDHAFHAGANFEYFHRLFAQLPAHLHDDSLVLLSLAEGCDAAIGEIARERGFELQIHRRWMVMLQFTYVFRVVRS
jgi:release factor glutamine methyltransferase